MTTVQKNNNEIKAHLRYLRMAPRKVRVVATHMKGKSAKEADIQLRYADKIAALPLRKLLQSAVANAKHNFQIEKSRLLVQNITVNTGPILKRYQPRSRGMASPIHKHTSHVTITLIAK